MEGNVFAQCIMNKIMGFNIGFNVSDSQSRKTKQVL